MGIRSTTPPASARRRGTRPGATPSEVSARQRIVAEARRHFFAHGFRSVTMDDLARELGMSKKTLYDHFPTKNTLVEAAMLDKFHRIEQELEHIASECSSDFLMALQQLLACLQRHTEEIQPSFVRDVRRNAPELFAIVERRRATLIQRHFGRLFGAGRRSGLIRKDIPARLITEILLGAVQAIMNPAKMEELDLTPRTGLSAIVTVILEGVVTGKARVRR